jgi:trehalose 6-phosphate synthase/phosphatase
MNLIIVSNRLPITVSAQDGRLRIIPSPGGLATGLRGAHDRAQGLWVGWPGDLTKLTPTQRAALDDECERARLVCVELTTEEVEQYYEGFSNGVIWPLFHYLLDRVPLDANQWGAYELVNRKFANAVAPLVKPGSIVWVQDYQLMLVPAMLRERVPDVRIGFFLHIPFPSFEVFRILPWRRQLLEGLLGADLLAFHTSAYARYCITALRHLLDLDITGHDAAYRGRNVRVAAFPMGVDVARFEALAAQPSVQQRAHAIREEAAPRRVLVGIDRLDYTKGIPRRLLSFERLLKRRPEWRDEVRFIQVAVPSRSGIELYRNYRSEVHEIVGRINGTTSTVTSVPVHYMYRSLPIEEIVALYLAADAMLVTPLRDGMNLVAKEFVASRLDEDGVLVLSEFAGAADELGEGLLVNPYDIDAVGDTMERALGMSRSERRSRMRGLRARVRSNTVHDWADRFLRELEAFTETGARPTPAPTDTLIAALVERIRLATKVALLIDYDGTLVPLAATPDLARPDAALLDTLQALASDPNRQVHIVSGRRRDALEEWLGDLPVTLWAEHGLWRRDAGSADWKASFEPNQAWMGGVRPILERAVLETPGSFIEDKWASMAWHYRLSDPLQGREQAQSIRTQIASRFENLGLEAIAGSKVVEVRPEGMTKGLAVRLLLAEQPDALFVAIGDDRTDEDMFAALPEPGIAVHVGTTESRAGHRLPGPAAVRQLLEALGVEPASARPPVAAKRSARR